MVPSKGAPSNKPLKKHSTIQTTLWIQITGTTKPPTYAAKSVKHRRSTAPAEDIRPRSATSPLGPYRPDLLCGSSPSLPARRTDSLPAITVGVLPVPRGASTMRTTGTSLTWYTMTRLRLPGAHATAAVMPITNTAWRPTARRPRIPMSTQSEGIAGRRT